MSEWNYYDKREIIDNAKTSAKGVADNQRDIKALRDEVKSLRDEQRQLLQVNRQLLDAFNRMAREVQQMRADMYPNDAAPKPGLKRPAAMRTTKKT